MTRSFQCPVHDIRLLAPILLYAAAWNKIDPRAVEPLLAQDVRYFSQFSLVDVVGKADVCELITAMMQTMNDDTGPRYELAITSYGPRSGEPCMIVFDSADDEIPTATIVLDVGKGKLTAITECAIPAPESMYRTRIVPV